MSPQQVQTILADFAHRARRVGVRLDGAEVWRFEIDETAYDLHYWEEDNTAVRKYLGGAQAAREFAQLQALQKLGIPAPRVIANLKGFRIGQRKGDACILVHDPSVVSLSEVLRSRQGQFERLRLDALLIALLERLHGARLCPVPLTIDRFGLRAGEVILQDGAGEFSGLVTGQRLRELDRSTRLATTASQRLRFWNHFSDEKPPRGSRRDANDLVRHARRGTGPFDRIAIDGWTGIYLRHSPLVLPWSAAAGIDFDADSWRSTLSGLIERASENAIKSDPAGEVGGATISLAGRTLELIVKRPGFKPGLQGRLRRFRQSRALRTWSKTWRLLGLGIPCELPLLVLERRSALRLLDQVILFERVPGDTFAKADLDDMSDPVRADALRSCGRLLQRIESFHFTHTDAKNTNWIAWRTPSGRVQPVLIDLDGVRFYPWRGKGLERFVRAMKTHSQIRKDDLLAIQSGYAGPRARYAGTGLG